MTTRDDLRTAKALQGMEFPASKAELLDYASDRSADAKTMQALESIPESRFANMDDVIDAVPQEPEGTDRPGGTDR